VTSSGSSSAWGLFRTRRETQTTGRGRWVPQLMPHRHAIPRPDRSRSPLPCVYWPKGGSVGGSHVQCGWYGVQKSTSVSAVLSQFVFRRNKMTGADPPVPSVRTAMRAGKPEVAGTSRTTRTASRPHLWIAETTRTARTSGMSRAHWCVAGPGGPCRLRRLTQARRACTPGFRLPLARPDCCRPLVPHAPG